MKLSISNIAWNKDYDKHMYNFIDNIGFNGLEIAPTRVIETNPYENLNLAKNFLNYIKSNHKFIISSAQSIWFGKKENIFDTVEERNNLIEYTKKAIDFCRVIECTNLVFGCPKNRIMRNPNQYNIALDFFNAIGKYDENTIISIEPNPSIYGTNFINTTEEAINFVKELNLKNIRVNLDMGTIIQNKEDISIIPNNIDFINHIHISEPNLNIIQKRDLHKNIFNILNECGYNKFVSIEMKNVNNIAEVKQIMYYIKEEFA